MSVNVHITHNRFDKGRIAIGRGQHIKFKSTDGTTYVVDCGADDREISAMFPFTIPGDDKYHRLEVDKNAVKKDFTCSIISPEAASAQENDGEEEPPHMVIKVE
jgi:hypothetical protein